jgi:hypothetical protein
MRRGPSSLLRGRGAGHGKAEGNVAKEVHPIAGAGGRG